MNDTGQDVAVEAGPNGPENVCPFTPNLLKMKHNRHRIMTWCMRGARIWVQPGTIRGDSELRTYLRRLTVLSYLFQQVLQCSQFLNMGG